MKCNVLAVLQARTTSSRLPKKVLKKICGKHHDYSSTRAY